MTTPVWLHVVGDHIIIGFMSTIYGIYNSSVYSEVVCILSTIYIIFILCPLSLICMQRHMQLVTFFSVSYTVYLYHGRFII